MRRLTLARGDDAARQTLLSETTATRGQPRGRDPVCYVCPVTVRSLVFIIITASIVTAACGGPDIEEQEQPPPMANSGITTLQSEDVTPGTGAEASKGQTVRVHYTGWLYDPSAPNKRGRKFDSSKDRNDPFEFRLGAGEVITGWDEGVAGMKVGGTRILTIPPAMGYGAQGAGGVIPPNATLVFEVELLGVR
jgi:FKBP-type peptidyl-prolyl cis-trans isomerase FkpA